MKVNGFPNNNGEETVDYSSAIPEPATEDGMNVDEEEGISNEEQLRNLLLLFIVLFQAKHLSVKAGEDLLAFLSFFVRSLDHSIEIPSKISTARTMVNYSSAIVVSLVSLFALLVEAFTLLEACILAPVSMYASLTILIDKHNPCGNALFVGSNLKPELEYPYNSIIETLKKFFMRPSFEQQIEQWRRRSVDEDVMFDIYDGRSAKIIDGIIECGLVPAK
ncbi:hypothetical protein G6F43_012345 [Rhizopus delemar]|nr:hypothetical protein G6F43_012345 [Rhizopus delemar]